MRIEILDNKFEQREYTNKETGETRTSRKQQAYLHFEGQPYPTPFVVSLQEDQEPYEKGDYTFSPQSFSTNKYGNLEFAFNIVLEKSGSARPKAVA